MIAIQSLVSKVRCKARAKAHDESEEEPPLLQQNQHQQQQHEHEQEGFVDRCVGVAMRVFYAAYFEVCVLIFSNLGCVGEKVGDGRFSRLEPFVPCDDAHTAVC